MPWVNSATDNVLVLAILWQIPCTCPHLWQTFGNIVNVEAQELASYTPMYIFFPKLPYCSMQPTSCCTLWNNWRRSHKCFGVCVLVEGIAKAYVKILSVAETVCWSEEVVSQSMFADILVFLICVCHVMQFGFSASWYTFVTREHGPWNDYSTFSQRF